MLQIFIFLALFQPAQGKIDVKITGIEHAKGTLRVGLYDSDNNYLKHSTQHLKVAITSKNMVIVTFDQVPWNTYAISIFHDVNDNGKLDSNFLRIPKEPYGFSNNAKATFGPPSFKEASFSHQNHQTTLTIEL